MFSLPLSLLLTAASLAASPGEVVVFLSSEDGSNQLSSAPALSWQESGSENLKSIRIDPSKRYQDILGMGASLEHATCANLAKLGEKQRAEVIEKLVNPKKGIGMNLMRLCIGASDFIGEDWYSYNDLPEGKTDPDLAGFSIEKDRSYILPAVKCAQQKNPDLLFFASPWSPPAWMKKNHSLLGGRMDARYYPVYAKYLIAFIQAYAKEGVPLYALTPQNEPLMGHKGYPTCLWTPKAQRDFIRDHLGPQLRQAGLETALWAWDHNWNYLKFPRTILEDKEAARYVDGVAFHLYEGKVEAQSELHEEFPETDIFFTEGSTFRTYGAIKIIQILRHWARSYNAWVILLDEDRKPNNGPHTASPTCIQLNHDGSLEYRYDYYMYGQFMKFIPRGSRRIASDGLEQRFANVAFERPDGSIVLVVANAEKKPQRFQVRYGAHAFTSEIKEKSVATYCWAAH